MAGNNTRADIADDVKKVSQSSHVSSYDDGMRVVRALEYSI